MPLLNECTDSNGVAAVKEEFECLSSFLEFLENEWEPWSVHTDSIVLSFFIIALGHCREKKLNGYRTQGRIVFELIWALFKPGMKVKVLDTPSGEYASPTLRNDSMLSWL